MSGLVYNSEPVVVELGQIWFHMKDNRAVVEKMGGFGELWSKVFTLIPTYSNKLSKGEISNTNGVYKGIGEKKFTRIILHHLKSVYDLKYISYAPGMNPLVKKE